MSATYDVSGTLNDLIQICIDGQEGFETAADAIHDPILKGELLGYSSQRQEFASDLQAVVSLNGDKPATSGDLSAAVHRGWMNIKTAVTSNDRYAILAECERGEDSAVEAYRKALESGLPADIEQKVQEQFVAVRATHDRIKALRDAAKEG